MKDVLLLQSDIATTVAEQLRATLVGDEAGKIAAGGTQNPDAFDAYLRATQLAYLSGDEATARAALTEADKAIRLDPLYAAAYATRATILRSLAILVNEGGLAASLLEQSRQSAERAITLAPMLADGHVALAAVCLDNLNFPAAPREVNRALALEPGSAAVQSRAGVVQSAIGNHEAAIAAARRAVELDPQNYRHVVNLAVALYLARRFSEAVQIAREAAAINPRATQPQEVIVGSYLALGRAAEARHACLALAYPVLEMTTKATAELQDLQRLVGSDEPTLLAEIYAQWGDSGSALRWLDTATRQHDPGLENLKSDWMLDPIRNLPRFQALERQLHVPP